MSFRIHQFYSIYKNEKIQFLLKNNKNYKNKVPNDSPLNLTTTTTHIIYLIL